MFGKSYGKSKGLFGISWTLIIIGAGILTYSMKWLENSSWYPTFLKEATFLKVK